MTDSNMSRTYRFDVSVRLDPLLSQDEVYEFFQDILRAADARITYVTQDRRGHPDYRAVQLRHTSHQ